MAQGMSFGAESDLAYEAEFIDQTTKGTTTQRTTEEQTAAAKQQQLSQQISATSTLDEDTQKLIKDLIGNLSAGIIDSEDDLLGDLAKSVFERSQTAQADITQQISDITGAARFEGEQQLKQLQTQLAQQSGGSLANTLVASSTAVGRGTLEAQLARTKGELTLAGREQVTQELATAMQGAGQAQGQPLENITNLLNVLKGADVQQQATTEQESTTESTLSRILDTITKSTQNLSQKRDKTSTSTGTSFDMGI